MILPSCPFCGVSVDLPHETQEACIAALHGEISRMRDLVDRLRIHPAPEVSGSDPNPEPSVSRPE
jgi:hypothetical protein